MLGRLVQSMLQRAASEACKAAALLAARSPADAISSLRTKCGLLSHVQTGAKHCGLRDRILVMLAARLLADAHKFQQKQHLLFNFMTRDA